LILRKTLADAKKPSSIMHRAREWLTHTDAWFDSQENAWRFPSGATVMFGRLSDVGDAFMYQGAEFQCICADEITQLNPQDLDYVCNSRLRRPRCPFHKKTFDPSCPSCLEYAPISKVPLRIRTASNPGGQYHAAVKNRYRIKKIPGKRTPNGKQLYAGTHPDRPHIPAFIDDNPYLDQDEYSDTLSQLDDPVTVEQLLAGNWGISADGRFKKGWVKRYTQVRNWYSLGQHTAFYRDQLHIFMMIDPAASTKNLPGKEEVKKRNPSHTAITVWAITPDGNLLLLAAARHQQEVPQTKVLIKQFYGFFPEIAFVGMEKSTMSIHLFQTYVNEGLNMRAFSPHTGDKVARSVDASNRMFNGRIWLPDEESEWLNDFEDEVFTWTGDPIETDDQVDCLSYAAIYCTHYGIHDRPITTDCGPSVIHVD
jgi:predicted phage terminase large subunit-like protein